jgi:hypothetical protein
VYKISLGVKPMFDISKELSTIESSEMVTLFFVVNSFTTDYKSVLAKYLIVVISKF